MGTTTLQREVDSNGFRLRSSATSLSWHEGHHTLSLLTLVAITKLSQRGSRSSQRDGRVYAKCWPLSARGPSLYD